jgi:hypothetical protein
MLFAQNPRIYSAIGDKVYNNVENINNLKNLTAYPYDANKIDAYVKEVNTEKEKAFKIEEGDKSIDAKAHLNKLRELSKGNDAFARDVDAYFNKALKEKNSILFLEIVNSGLLDTKKNKEKIMNYYIKHQDEINPEGAIQQFLDESKELERRRAAWALAQKRKEAERVKHLREKDKAEAEALERKLSEEVKRKKREIREHQKKELSIH